uniref:SH3 and multiple ankyrin repeat domains protein 3-like isoform X1 n=2 Tax=Styela clava TaxID=7725 RepID=UPI001939D36E|nr:SH3 and multiple ankyrin repeat domains protein 3-like isoform X1 [Styela clava]
MFSSYDVTQESCQVDVTNQSLATSVTTADRSATKFQSFIHEDLSSVLPPPAQFANGDINKEELPTRNERPPIPEKPQFMANTNMNNNNRQNMGTLNGTTKLKNLMLLREPTRKPVIRLFSSDDESCDSLSDSDDSGEEFEMPIQKEDTISTSGTSTISSISTSSLDQITEEDRALYVIAKITIPEQKLTKCMQLKITETVWTAKQRIIQSLAKKFPDPLNYGLYHEKYGMFLLDHKPMSEYIEAGSVGAMQMLYKCRKMADHPHISKEGRKHTKMQSASKRRDFLSYVQQYSTDKIYSLIRKGIDPNFQCPNTGETPLTILSSGQSRAECVSVFMALLGGGAHLDYRNKRGFTPMHVAARNGNIQMIRTLIEFQASPNVVDSRDLTPLYHCILLGSDPSAARILIQSNSIIGCRDSQGWTEIHQACRHGRLQLLELLLSCDSVGEEHINARNASGNTPLHVCALYNQEFCAVTLLMHGADTTILNFSNQDAVQVAHVASNVSVASLIKDFPNNMDNIDHPLIRARAETVSSSKPPIAPSPDTSPKHNAKKHNGRSTWTPSSLMKHSKQYILQKQHSVSGTLGRSKGESYTIDTAMVENRFDSKLPPNAKIPDVKYPKTTGNGVVDENKVRIVVRNYDAKTSEELSLRVGTRVIVLNARSAPPGYHDGMVGNQRGFFPKDCVEEVRLRRPLADTGQRATSDNVNERHSSGKFKSSTKKQHTSADGSSLTQRNTMPDSVSIVSFESNDEVNTGRKSTSSRSEDLANLQATSVSGIFHNTRSVALWKGSDGFGFILRGAKSEGPVHEFNPSARYPALQYLESIEEGSNAHNAGLRSGDFIIRIGDTDVRKFGHQQLVDTIRSCGEPLHMQVTTVINRTQNGDTVSLHSNSSGKQSQKGHGKSDSISSALDQLDNVIAMEDMDGSERTASLRRLPGGRRIGGDHLQNLFSRPNGSVDPIATLPRAPQTSTFTSAKKPLCVPPPSLSSSNTFQYDNTDNRYSSSHEDTQSVRSMSSSSSNSSTFTTWGRYSGTANAPPPVTNGKEFRSHSVSGATGERLLMQSGAKSKRLPPPPPRRVDSRLSVSIPEEEPVRSPSHYTSPHKTTQHMVSHQQTDMASAIALAARNRADRLSQSEEQKRTEPVATTPKAEEAGIEETPTKSVAEISSALSIALAAKERMLSQQKSGKSNVDVKKPQNTFTVNPNSTRSSAVKINTTKQFSTGRAPSSGNTPINRHVLPPPPSNLPPPPPPDDFDDGLALPPPPSFPAPDHHTRFNHMTFDELLDLPPPPSDLLPSPNSNNQSHISPPEGYRREEQKTKPNSLGFLPPPPIPPPHEDDDGCTSPNGADNLSNADSGVADVAGDGLNLSHHHRNHVSGDNHSTVSSVSTTSTMSSEDTNSDYSSERAWPLREVRNSSNEERSSSPAAPAGNMYLDVLKKAKSKQTTQEESVKSQNEAKKNNLRPGITVTKMTFAPVTVLPPPAEKSKEASKSSNVFPPAPKEYTTNETKPLFGKAPAVQTQKVNFMSPAAKAPEKATPIKTTPIVGPGAATKTTINPAKSVNNNESPEKKPTAPASAQKPLVQWTVTDVSDWLKDLGLQMYISSFEENEIAGEHLPDLGKDELIELGVKPFGHRLTIDRSIKKLTS